MEIKVSVEQGRVPVTVVHPEGNVDSSTYQSFQAQVDKLIDGGARYILVDLTHVPFVSSAGLRGFHEIFIRLHSLSSDKNDEEMHRGIAAGTYKSPHLKLLHPSKESAHALKLAGFDMYIESFKDFKTAISSF
jgi:anti-anti-sigma factor